jgi:hypothetical protein
MQKLAKATEIFGKVINPYHKYGTDPPHRIERIILQEFISSTISKEKNR